MALRVWLPLNGNINNQGLGPQPINDGALTYDNGKIGQCRKTGGAKFTANQSEQIFNDNGFTYCAWVYVQGEEGGAIGSPNCFFGRDGTPRIYAIFQYPKVDDLHLSWTQYNDDKSSSIYKAGIQCNDFFDVKTWVHLAVTYESGKITIYKNGIQYATTTGTPTWSTQPDGYHYETWALTNTPNAYFNDVRVYDECLSQKQIKEISKGLVAHYKLDGPKANENLILRSDKVTSGSQASGITRTYMDDGTLKVVSTSGNGNYCSVGFAENSNTNVGNKLSVGDTYTISCDIKVEEGTTFPTLFINSGNGYKQLGGPVLKLNTWQRVYYTNTWNEPGTGYGNIALHLGFSGAIGTYYFKNFKLEKGNLTSWIPAPTDPMYTSLGYANDIGTDDSGNGYNATKNGTLTFNSDSARYSGSTCFPGTCANYLYRPYFSFLTGPLTFNCWVFQTSATPATQFIVSQGRDNTCNGFNLSSSNGIPKLWAGGEEKIQITGTTSIIDNKWHMLTGTWDGTTAKLYVDGTLVNSAAMGDITYTQASGGFVIGKMSYSYTSTTNYFPFVGSISDVKVYATALSADDIKELYQTSALVDNRGSFYSYEFNAVGVNMVEAANHALAEKKWAGGFSGAYSQTNCTPSLTDEGYRIYRPPNIDASAHNMWGGVNFHPNYAGDILIKGHSYIMLYDVKGKTSNAQATTGWSNMMGWGGGGLNPQPTNVSYKMIPSNFDSDEWQTFYYKWDLTDDVRKVCTQSYSRFVEGTEYLSYADFQIGWVYTSTGEWGTDIYFRNFRLYDITNPDKPQIVKTGLVISNDINEIGDKTKIRQIGYDASNFIEI